MTASTGETTSGGTDNDLERQTRDWLSALRLRFRIWRNRRIADPDFQALVQRVPGLSAIGQTKANALYRMTTAIVHAQVLAASIESGLLDLLSDGPLPRTLLIRKLGLPTDGAERLIRAASRLGLVTQVEDRIALDDLGVVAAHDDGITSMVRHHKRLADDLADPLAVFRERTRDAKIAQLWAYSANPESRTISAEDASAYSDLMRASQAAVASQVLHALDFSTSSSLIDIGGGTGAFVAAVARKHPQLRLAVFDLPPVVEAGETAGIAPERTIFHAGSFFHDALPKGFDCYSLVRVLYDHDDDAALAILKAVRAAMAPGATLIVAEPMGGERGPEALVDTYFTVYLAAMASGKCRTHAEHTALLKEAGFSRITRKTTLQPLYTGLIVASR